MKNEVDKAYKRRAAKDKKKQEQMDLAPVRNLQPKSRSIRYDNVKSALAEENVLAQILRESALLNLCGSLTPEQFSVSLFGRVFSQLQNRYKQGLSVSLAVLEELNPEEVAHLTGICQKQEGPVNEAAFRDCIKIILAENQSRGIASDDDLMALRNKFKESKGAKV